MSGGGHGGHGGGGHKHIHIGSLLIGAGLVALHRYNHQRHVNRVHKKWVHPLSRHRLDYKQSMQVVNAARIFGFIVMAWFAYEYVQTIWSM